MSSEQSNSTAFGGVPGNACDGRHPNIHSIEDVAEQLGSLQARLNDALWREHVAELAVQGLVEGVDFTTYGDHAQVVDLFDIDRPVLVGDVRYVIEKVRKRSSELGRL